MRRASPSRRVLPWALALAVPACGEGGTSPDPVIAVVVTPASDSLYVGDSRTFTAAAVTQAGDSLNGRPVLWASSNPAVASVSSAGVATAAGTGTAHIRATIDGLSDSAAVVVLPDPVATVTLSPPSDTIGTNWTLQLAATLRDAGGQPLTGRQIVWTTTSPAATVSATGLVTGGAPGTARIVATSEDRADTAFVEVMDCAGTPTAPWISARNRFTVSIGRGQIQRFGSPLAAVGAFRTAASFGVPNPTPVLFGGGLLYGTGANDLVLAYDFAGALPSDIEDGPVCVLAAADTLDHTFADVRPTAGIGPASLEVRQETFASSTSADTAYVLLRYTFTNTTSQALSQLYVGFGADWDLGWGNPALDDVLRWNAGLAVAEAVVSDSTTMTPIVAVVPVTASGGAAAAGWLNGADPPREGYFGPLAGGVTLTAVGPGDIRGVTGAGPFTIAPNGRLVVYFALVGGDNRTAFNTAVGRARAAAAALGF